MAFEEIPLSQEEIDALGAGGSFYKFEAIGQKLVGKVVKIEKTTNNHFQKEETRMTVKHKDAQTGAIKESIVTLNASLKAQAEKAGVAAGHAVMITYTGDKQIPGMSNAMKLFKFLVDKNPQAAKPAAAPPPPPPPPTPAASADDIDF